MKKVLFVAVAVVAALSFTSCKKQCKCTVEGKTVKVDKSELDGHSCAELSAIYEDMGVGSCK